MDVLYAVIALIALVSGLWCALPRAPSLKVRINRHTLKDFDRENLLGFDDVLGFDAVVLHGLLRFAHESHGWWIQFPMSARSREQVRALITGCSVDGVVTLALFRDFQVLLAGVCGMIGALFGWCLSGSLAVILGCLGLVVGFRAPLKTLRHIRLARAAQIERESAGVFEMMSLMLLSGISFDRAVGLLRQHSQGLYAKELGCALDVWEAGLASRSGALEALAQKYASDVLRSSFASVNRSMRLGTPLAPTLSALAEQARRIHVASVEERVMKAPVKMMFPIGMLILPSMLILILGPVLLDLIIPA